MQILRAASFINLKLRAKQIEEKKKKTRERKEKRGEKGNKKTREN